jgi:hypothetical protein
VYQPSDIAWDAITSHLLFVLRHPAAPPSICLQTACTLDDIFIVIPHDRMAAPGDCQATVHRHVPAVLEQQDIPGGLTSSASIEHRWLAQALRHCTRFCKHEVIPYSLAWKQDSSLFRGARKRLLAPAFPTVLRSQLLVFCCMLGSRSSRAYTVQYIDV